MSYKRQKQFFSHDPENGQHGDCWRTGVACLLDMPREQVRHEHKDHSPTEWKKWTRKVLDEYGHTSISIPFKWMDGSDPDMYEAARFVWDTIGSMPFLLAGQSGRGVNHVVVVYTPDDIHDPAISGGGLDGPCHPDGFWWAEFIVWKP